QYFSGGLGLDRVSSVLTIINQSSSAIIDKASELGTTHTAFVNIVPPTTTITNNNGITAGLAITVSDVIDFLELTNEIQNEKYFYSENNKFYYIKFSPEKEAPSKLNGKQVAFNNEIISGSTTGNKNNRLITSYCFFVNETAKDEDGIPFLKRVCEILEKKDAPKGLLRKINKKISEAHITSSALKIEDKIRSYYSQKESSPSFTLAVDIKTGVVSLFNTNYQ
ncbi:MAG: hypothetical protein QMD94_03775, partial [Candidatus Omnitrophota bacterium]|nr:hypothetical protein [Candidatus Omnitrophota bacterium]